MQVEPHPTPPGVAVSAQVRSWVRDHPGVHRRARSAALGLATARGSLRKPQPPGASLRVLAHVPFYVPDRIGGAEQSLRGLLGFLMARGHRCVVLDESGVDREVDGVPVWNAVAARRRAAFSACDVVLSQHRPAARRAIRGARAAGVPVVYFVREPGMLPEVGTPDLVVFNSQHLLEREQDRVAAAHVLPPSIDPEHYRATPGDAVTLVNLNENKGAPLFFALAEAMPERRFLGVRGTWEQQLTPPHPLPNLELVEPVRDMRTIYRRTRVLLVPSARESFGRVALEAAASGIPTVAHPTPGLVECLGAAGTYVHRDDLQGWVRAVQQLDHPARYDSASQAARARSEEMAPDQSLSGFERRLHDLVAARRRAPIIGGSR